MSKQKALFPKKKPIVQLNWQKGKKCSNLDEKRFSEKSDSHTCNSQPMSTSGDFSGGVYEI